MAATVHDPGYRSRRAARRKAGLCGVATCSQASEPGRVYCARCQDAFARLHAINDRLQAAGILETAGNLSRSDLEARTAYYALLASANRPLFGPDNPFDLRHHLRRKGA